MGGMGGMGVSVCRAVGLLGVSLSLFLSTIKWLIFNKHGSPTMNPLPVSTKRQSATSCVFLELYFVLNMFWIICYILYYIL